MRKTRSFLHFSVSHFSVSHFSVSHFSVSHFSVSHFSVWWPMIYNKISTMSWIVLLALLLRAPQDPQIPPIGIIDVYGLRGISERQVREALQIKEGDSMPDDLDGAKREAARRLMSLPGVAEARISIVC